MSYYPQVPRPDELPIAGTTSGRVTRSGEHLDEFLIASESGGSERNTRGFVPTQKKEHKLKYISDVENPPEVSLEGK